MGQTERARPEGYLIWFLAATPGTAGPAPAIAQELSRLVGAPVHALVTTDIEGPLTPAVAQAVEHQLAPGETPGSISRFLDHWKPDFGVVIDRPNRPKLLAAAARREVPLFHALSSRSKRLVRYPSYIGSFHTCFAASAAEATALRQHIRDQKIRIETTGPLSDTVYALPCNDADCDDLARLLGGRAVWLAANVSRGEVAMIESAQRKAFRSAHRLLLILVPEDLEDAPAIASELEAQGWRTGLRTAGSEPDPEIQIYIADTEDELGMWYRLAPSSFVGGTFLPGDTPTDPFAPAALGSAVLHGPHTGPSPARFERLAAHGASMPVKTADELGEAVISLLSPDKAASLAQAGWATTTESAHVVERLAEVMFEIIEAQEENA